MNHFDLEDVTALVDHYASRVCMFTHPKSYDDMDAASRVHAEAKFVYWQKLQRVMRGVQPVVVEAKLAA